MPLLFENLNTAASMVIFTGLSPEEVLGQLKQIRLPCRIISIYGMNGKHFAWVQTEAKVTKRLVKADPQGE